MISRAAGVKSAADAAVFCDDSLALSVTPRGEQHTNRDPEDAEDAEQDASARAWEDRIAPRDRRLSLRGGGARKENWARRRRSVGD